MQLVYRSNGADPANAGIADEIDPAGRFLGSPGSILWDSVRKCSEIPF